MSKQQKIVDEIQKSFFESLIKEDASLCPTIKENNIASFQRRWGVYSYAYRIRLIEIIEQDFPLLQKEVGKEKLRKWISEALKKEPSRHYGIGRTPNIFIAYLKDNNDKKYYDMACYELIRERLFDYEKVESYLLENLSKYNEGEIINLRPVINPSIQVYKSHWLNLDGEDPVYKSGKSFYYLLYSFQNATKELSISDLEKDLFEEIKKGSSIAELASKVDEKVLNTIFIWAKKGILINVQ